MKIDTKKFIHYLEFVVVGEFIGLALLSLFLYNSSFERSIPDAVKVVLITATFVAVFVFAMSRHPGRPK